MKININKFSYENVVDAYYDCRKHKSNKYDCIGYEAKLNKNLGKLYNELNSGKYKVSKFRYIYITQPKPREIWMSSFKDRVVHHLVCGFLEPFIVPKLITSTYACLKNRGTLKAAMDVRDSVYKETNNFDKYTALNTFYLKMDIHNYFCSINKEKLWNILKEYIEENSLLGQIVKEIVLVDVTRGVNRPNEIPINIEKSLWSSTSAGKGLPIGNLTSQFFANIYLNGLDYYIKHELGFKSYFRYVDDILVIDKDKEKLKELELIIDNYLRKNLGLYLNRDKTKINRVYNGVDFVGYVVKPYGVLLRKRLKFKIAQAIKRFKRKCDNISSLNSYVGKMKDTKSHKLRIKIFNKCSIPFITKGVDNKIIVAKGIL